MSYEITVKDVPAIRTAAIKVETSPQSIGDDLGRAYGALMAYVGSHGFAATDVQICFYRAWEQDNWVLEACLPVDGEVVEEGEVHPLEIPGGEAATTLHVGPYMDLGRAHEALGAWCQEHGRERIACYERYVTDPGQIPDPAQYQTEVIWVLRAM